MQRTEERARQGGRKSTGRVDADRPQISHQVVIAGGGPTGLMLAGELALAKIDVAIVERRASQHLPGSRAGGLIGSFISSLIGLWLLFQIRDKYSAAGTKSATPKV